MSQDNNIKDQNTDEDIKRGIDKDKNEENRIHKKLVLYNDLNENDRAKNDWQ